MTAALDDIAVPLRSEVEVASNAVFGVMRAGLIPGSVKVQQIAEAAGLAEEDLRAAAVRHERAAGSRVRLERLAPQVEAASPGRPLSLTHRESETPHKPRLVPASSAPAPLVRPADTRNCTRCRQTKPLAAFPARGPDEVVVGQPGRSRVCTPCLEKIVRTPDAATKAIEKIRAHLELPAGTTCSVCEQEIRAGDHVEADHVRHKVCPAH